MATTFFEITGSLLHPGNITWGSPRQISLTSLYGGERVGRALQLSVQDEKGSAFVGLTREDVLKLVVALSAWASGIPSENLSALFEQPLFDNVRAPE